PRTRARQRLRELLAEQALRPRPTGGRPDRLLALAGDQGAEPLPVRVAAAWPETVTTGQVIDWWRGKTSLGGVNPSREVADAVLAALAGWARDTQPAGPVTTTTRYLLEGVRLPAVAPGAARPWGAPTSKEGQERRTTDRRRAAHRPRREARHRFPHRRGAAGRHRRGGAVPDPAGRQRRQDRWAEPHRPRPGRRL